MSPHDADDGCIVIEAFGGGEVIIAIATEQEVLHRCAGELLTFFVEFVPRIEQSLTVSGDRVPQSGRRPMPRRGSFIDGAQIVWDLLP